MHWLSHGVEDLVLALQEQRLAPDVVVVGSGYGGAVAALRFAEHGQQLVVLERGAEYRAGEFPNDLGQFGAHVRSQTQGSRGSSTLGYEDALFDFRLGQGASALVGNGLGGGSLINAAVALRPDARVFEQTAWPAQLRADQLDGDYLRALEFLEIQAGAQQRAAPDCVPQTTQKYQRMQELGAAAAKRFGSATLKVSTRDVPLAIEFRKHPGDSLGPRKACNGCGDCCTGCNHDAKLSLDKTYLARARQAGAQMFTGVTVLYVAHQPDMAHPGRDWVVVCCRTTERQQWGEAGANGRADAVQAYTFALRCQRVVLSAGTFGSTEILLRSRQVGLDVASRWLGQGISANGDDLSAAYDLKRPVHGVGQGSGLAPRQPVGPTISAVVCFDDMTDTTRSTVTEDGGVPGMLGLLVNEGLSTLGLLPQLARFGRRGAPGADPLAVQPELIDHSLVLLGMGHDSAAGYAALSASHERLQWGWAEGAVDAAPALHRSRGLAVEELGAEFIPNPASGVLPDAVASVLSGPKMQTGWVTVHPLGGCRMGSSAHLGVVNHQGQVFRDDGSVHLGLLVMDGSVIPSALGVNPLLTITALAERACRLVLAQCAPAASPHPAPPLAPAPPAVPLLHARPDARRGTVLAELLRGPMHSSLAPAALPPWLAAAASPQGQAGALFLEMDVVDWTRLWQDPHHTVHALAGTPGARALTASRLVFDDAAGASMELHVTGGQIQLFAPVQTSFWRRAAHSLRTLATYTIARWYPDGCRPGATPASGKVMWDGLKLLWNAAAPRSFTYALTLSDGQDQFHLRGSKWIDPALPWSELWSWVRAAVRTGSWPAPQRRSVWEQLTQLEVRLCRAGSTQPLATGRLAMDLPEMVRRIAPQLKPGADGVNALGAFMSYPLLVARYLINSRILDFRLPDYAAGLPLKDPVSLPDDGQFELAQDQYPDIVLPDGRRIPAQAPVCLQVAHQAGAKAAQDGGKHLRIGLVHYAQEQPRSHVQSDGMRRHQSIILLNGFAQNTLPFVAPELGPRALASMLYAQGWDIWLLEYRVSPWLRASKEFSSMDDIGACDIPAAVNHVLEQLGRAHDDPPTVAGQIFVFSHCVGSASLAMGLLGGHLCHPDGRAKLAGVLFSQFHPYVIGSVTAQMRLPVATLLVNAMGLDFVEFSAGTAQADGLHAAMDRLFASFSYDAAERCPGETDLRQPHPDTCSCKRMSGFLSRLFRHDQLVPRQGDVAGTHEKLDQYFGRTNLGVFLHGAKCVDYEHLVNADGQNVYVTDANVRKYLSMPVMLLHGQDNVLFDKESLTETWTQFSRAFGAQRLATGADRFLVAPGMAHFDCTIGARAPEVVFPAVLDFFQNAISAELPVGSGHNRLRARLPRSGPVVGWCREEGTQRYLRVWIEVDDAQADEALAALTLVTAGRHRQVQAWSLSRNPVVGTVRGAAPVAHDNGIFYAVADVAVPRDWHGRIHIAMVSLHRFTGPDSRVASPKTHTPWPQDWGVPMAAHEARQARGRTPSHTIASAQSVSVTAPGHVGLAPRPSCEPYVPGPSIAPLPIALTVQDALELLHPLSVQVQLQRSTARQADPATLSRQRRNQRWMDECVVRLHARQWQGALRFMAATCRHPGLTPLEAQRNGATLTAMALRQRSFQASFMALLGDQIYADAQGGVLGTTSSLEMLLPAYRDAWNAPGWRAVARNLPMHMVMDDHEITDNWSRDELALGGDKLALYANAVSAFNAFQRPHGPVAEGSLHENCAWQYGGAWFLSLNTRVHRDRALGPQQLRRFLDAQQWTVLESWLLRAQAAGNQPKFLLTGSVVAPGLVQGAGRPAPRDMDNWQLVGSERRRLLSFIAEQRIHNVVFLSGDYHCSASATIDYSDSPVRSYCLVTPALHAPLPFANVQVNDVLVQESIGLAHGRASVQAQAYAGDGWLECVLERPGLHWELQVAFRTQGFDLDAAQWQRLVWALN